MLASCPFCHAPLPEAAVRFCLSCGHQLPSRDEDSAAPRTADLGTPLPPSRDTPSRDKPPSSRSNLILALVAVLVIGGGGAGAYLVLRHKDHTTAGTNQDHQTAAHPSSQGSASPLGSSTGPSTPGSATGPSTPGSSAEQTELTQFLTAVRGSVAARTLVKKAVLQVGACTMTPAAGVSRLEQAITDRKNVLAMLGRLSVSAIPAGQSMRADLENVLNLSISADRDFIGWMQDPQSTQDCPTTTTQDASYSAGLTASSQAMQAKNQFLAVWNPLAEQFSLPTYTNLDI